MRIVLHVGIRLRKLNTCRLLFCIVNQRLRAPDLQPQGAVVCRTPASERPMVLIVGWFVCRSTDHQPWRFSLKLFNAGFSTGRSCRHAQPSAASTQGRVLSRTAYGRDTIVSGYRVPSPSVVSLNSFHETFTFGTEYHCCMVNRSMLFLLAESETANTA
jgi:hypothetical protein